MNVETHPWHDQQHHGAEGGYRNVWGAPRDVSFFKAFRWMLARPFQQKDNVAPPVQPVAADTLKARPARMRLTWLGHSAFYLQTPTQDILLDPMLGPRASPVSFAGPPRIPDLPLALEDLPGVDAVVISHDHYDHLDKSSIAEIAERFDPLFIVPLGIGALVRDWGAQRVVELDWWQYVDLDGLRYHCTPAQHFSGRGLTNRDGTLWASWYLEALDGSLDVYFGGDTGYAPFFAEIRERLGPPEVALIPVGAYLPRWFMKVVHVNPEEAMQAFLDLEAEHFIPIHWGTFDLADETIQAGAAEAQQHAAKRGVADQLHLLDIGASFTLEAQPRSRAAAE